jgi:apolipoprotein N-acyltransferase
VPFGEFIPAGFAWFMAYANIPMSSFTRGPEVQTPLAVAGQHVAANICYEDVFGEEIIRALPSAGILANLSNTAWFGHSLAQPQHLQIAQMRAAETGRSMLRATNTGMTAIIDAQGHVSATLPAFTTGVLLDKVRAYEGLTPYARFGNGLALGLMTMLGILGLSGRRKRAD